MILAFKPQFLPAILTIFFIGCTTPKGESSVDSGKGYNIKVIDSCEYIECDYGILNQRVYSLTHKGNCEYCVVRSATNVTNH